MRINWKLVLALLLIPSLCFGGMIIRKVSSSGSSKTYIYQADGFESPDFSTGEINGQDSWAETAASTDRYNITTSKYYSGSQSFQTVIDSTAEWLERTFTAQTGTFTVDMYLQMDRGTEPAGDEGRLTIADGDVTDGSKNSVYIKTDSGTLYSYNGSSYDTVGTFSDNTWHHLEIEINLTTDKAKYWIDGTYQVENDFRATQSSVNKIGVKGIGDTGRYWYIDDLEIYEGSRQ